MLAVEIVRFAASLANPKPIKFPSNVYLVRFILRYT